jgi:hypothetical protein
MLFMPRGELKSALGARLKQLTAQRDELAFVRASIKDGATGADGDVPEPRTRKSSTSEACGSTVSSKWTRSLKRLNEGTRPCLPMNGTHGSGQLPGVGNDRCSPEIHLTE